MRAIWNKEDAGRRKRNRRERDKLWTNLDRLSDLPPGRSSSDPRRKPGKAATRLFPPSACVPWTGDGTSSSRIRVRPGLCFRHCWSGSVLPAAYWHTEDCPMWNQSVFVRQRKDPAPVKETSGPVFAGGTVCMPTGERDPP